MSLSSDCRNGMLQVSALRHTLMERPTPLAKQRAGARNWPYPSRSSSGRPMFPRDPAMYGALIFIASILRRRVRGNIMPGVKQGERLFTCRGDSARLDSNRIKFRVGFHQLTDARATIKNGKNQPLNRLQWTNFELKTEPKLQHGGLVGCIFFVRSLSLLLDSYCICYFPQVECLGISNFCPQSILPDT